jgi:hypothetical protein
MSRGLSAAVVGTIGVVAFGAALFVARSAAGQPAPGKSVLGPPLTQAQTGRLQCYEPNTETRHCQSLAGYVAGTGGRIDNPASVLLSKQPLIVMQTTTPVTIERGQVCGPVRAEDVSAASFTVDGLPAPADVTASLRSATLAAMQGVIGKTICTAYVPEGNAFVAQATVDGVRRPESDQKVIWVSPSDGYSVGP